MTDTTDAEAYPTITSLIGNTPMVEIRGIRDGVDPGVRIMAKLEGFKIVNGRPDLSSDSNETLMYIALAHVLKDDPKKPIRNISYSNTQYKSSRREKTGSLIITYQIGKKPKVKQQFDFKKENNEWIVSKTNKIK